MSPPSSHYDVAPLSVSVDIQVWCIISYFPISIYFYPQRVSDSPNAGKNKQGQYTIFAKDFEVLSHCLHNLPVNKISDPVCFFWDRSYFELMMFRYYLLFCFLGD